MTSMMQQLVRATDSVVARAYLALFKERSALMCFLFHSLFHDQSEMDLNLIDPLDRTTVAHLRQLIEYYLNHGYRFISPVELLKGLEPGGKYALITFDDGYYNNRLALPILEKYQVPALFFISSNHVRENKNFWWDALYRERAREGLSRREIYREAVAQKVLRTEEIEQRLMQRYGPDVLRPHSDIDRPFAPDELREFASHPLVHLGNHTANHAILTNYTPGEIQSQIQQAQDDLLQMTGKMPTAIAYPNGANSSQVRQICRDVGLKLGFTTRPEKAMLPMEAGQDLMRLGRFVPHSHSPIATQCRTYRSDLLLYSKFRSLYLRFVRRSAVS